MSLHKTFRRLSQADHNHQFIRVFVSADPNRSAVVTEAQKEAAPLSKLRRISACLAALHVSQKPLKEPPYRHRPGETPD